MTNKSVKHHIQNHKGKWDVLIAVINLFPFAGRKMNHTITYHTFFLSTVYIILHKLLLNLLKCQDELSRPLSHEDHRNIVSHKREMKAGSTENVGCW